MSTNRACTVHSWLKGGHLAGHVHGTYLETMQELTILLLHGRVNLRYYKWDRRPYQWVALRVLILSARS